MPAFRGASALVFLLSSVFCSAADAAYIRSAHSSEGKEVIFLDGKIEAGDAQDLQRVIKRANAENQLVSAIRLNSPGGVLGEGAKLADIIRYGKIATVVPAGAQCASACFIVFAAGPEKYASYSANIGVHGASDQSGQEEGNATVSMGRAAKELGVPEAIIGKMVITPPDQIVWLSPSDLQSMGTTLTGRPSQVPPPQAMPQAPMQLDPSATASAAQGAPLKWEDLVDKAFAMSKEQNGGKPLVNRVCEPRVKSCSTAVFVKLNDGTAAMLRMSEDPFGKLISRDICSFNSFGDVRTCADWDTGAASREMKDAAGNWYTVGDN